MLTTLFKITRSPTKSLWLFCLMLGALAISGCALSLMPKASGITMGSQNVVIVGKIELIPPINVEFEQRVRGPGAGLIQNKILLATGPAPARLDRSKYGGAQFGEAIFATLGTTFFLQGNRGRTYVNGAAIEMGDNRRSGRIWLPGGLYFDVPANADAVYIGTLRYSRDAFNDITAVEVRDEYQAAVTLFRAKYGGDAVLTKSLLRKADPR